MQFPKGYLIAIGGAENKGDDSQTKNESVRFSLNGILKTLVELISKKETPRIALITTASSYPDDLAKNYRAAFKKLHCPEIDHLKIEERGQAEDPKILDRIKKANCVFFSGGDQAKLCSLLGGTSLIGLIKERYHHERFFITGTSAGAASMSPTIITGGDGAQGYLKGKIGFSLGFAFIEEAIIDTHFDQRGRLPRILQAIAAQPGVLGIGLSEDTGVIVEKGHLLKAIGSSCVVIVEGSMINYNNFYKLEDCAPITLGNVVVHTLSNLDQYDMEAKKLIPHKFNGYEKE